MGPVSYTHLDVYKRQPNNVPDEARVAELLASGVITNPVARTLAMLVNEAVDLVDRGEACLLYTSRCV